MKAIERTSRFAQPNHLPSSLRQQHTPAPLPATSSDLGEIGTNLWRHAI
jgi:hypothetical protein